MDPDPAAPRPGRFPLGLPALFLVLSLWLGGSFLLHSDQLSLPRGAESFDAVIYPWNFFWLREAPGAEDGSLLFTRRFFHPTGEGLALYTPTFGHALLSLPFQAVFGPSGLLVAMAFFLWFSSFATLCLTWLLARRLGLAAIPAAVAALLFTCGGARLMNAPRLNLFATEFLLLFLWSVVGLVQDGGWRRAGWTSLTALLLLVQSQPLFFQGVLALGLAASVSGIACLVRRRRPAWAVRGREVLAAVGLFLLLAAPFFSAMLGELAPAWRQAGPGDWFRAGLWREMAQEAASNPGLAQSQRLLQVPQNSLDLADLVVPGPQDGPYGGLLPRRAANPLFEGAGDGAVVSLSLGFAWILLLLAAGFGRRKTLVLGLAAFSAGAWWLSLGPVVHWQGSATGLPSAFSALRWLPLTWLTKSPIRLALLVQLGLAVMAGAGLGALVQGPGKGLRMRRWLAVGLVAAALVELAEPLPLRNQATLRIPDEIRAWAAEEGRWAVLDLPYEGYRVTAMAQALGAFHGRPIFFGLYPRAWRRNRDTFQSATWFQDLARMAPTATGETPVLPEDPEAVRRELKDLDVGFVVVHDFDDLPEVVRRHCQALRDYFGALGGEEQRLVVGEGYELTVFRLTERR